MHVRDEEIYHGVHLAVRAAAYYFPFSFLDFSFNNERAIVWNADEE